MRIFTTRTAAVLITAALVAAGCGGDDDDSGGSDTTAPPTEATVVIEGQSYTCEELVERECGDDFLDAFERWGEGIDDYVNSGRLGEFNGDTHPYSDVAYDGLTACLVQDVGGDEQDFIDIVREDYGADTPGTTFLPLWFEAIQSLCP